MWLAEEMIVLGSQVLVQVVDVSSAALDLGMLFLVDPEDVDVDALPRLGKPRFHLFRDEEIVRVGVGVQEGEAAVDRVVVGNRHEIHAALFGDPVNLFRPVVRVPRVGDAEVLECRMNRMAVQVGLLEASVGEPGRQVGVGGFRAHEPSTFAKGVPRVNESGRRTADVPTRVSFRT